LIDGVELFEKVHTLRAKYADKPEVLMPIEAELAKMRALNLNDVSYDWISFLAEVNKAVNDAAKQLAE
jgi:hypothetical protein